LNERASEPLSTLHLLICTYAELPLSGVLSGAQAWVTDGRKAGEGAGLGTGVPVYAGTINGTTTWRRFSDDAAVAV